MERLTIILPTYDRRHVLERTLSCYQALARSHRLLVIDDGSHDGTAGWLTSHGIDVVRQPLRRGLPAARNLGLALARTPWVLFGEDDVLMPPDHGDVLMRIAERLAHRHPAGAVAGRLFPGAAWSLPDRAPSDSPHALLDGRYLTGDFAAPLPSDRPLPSLHACALVRREAALAIGGYDERFTNSAFREESDFYARMWRAGYPCWLTPATWAIHVRHRLGGGCRGNPGALSKFVNRASYVRNNTRYVQRHARMWRSWGACTAPGPCSARWVERIIVQAVSAWTTR